MGGLRSIDSTTATGVHGHMEEHIWRFIDMEVWRYGGMVREISTCIWILIYRNIETHMEIWRFIDMEI